MLLAGPCRTVTWIPASAGMTPDEMGIQLKDAKDPATGEIVTTWEVRASGKTLEGRASGTTEVKR
jgi:hypothetical protein